MILFTLLAAVPLVVGAVCDFLEGPKWQRVS